MLDDCIYVGNWDQEITKLERRRISPLGTQLHL